MVRVMFLKNNGLVHPWGKINLLLLGISIVTVVLLYFRVYTLGFQVQWDDYWVVINNYTEQGFSLNNLKSVLVDFYHGQYAPLNQLYYIILHYFFGYRAGYFHAAGVCIHFVNAMLVFKILYFFGYQHLKIEDKRALKIAALSTIIFIVHPLNVEAVVWIAASKILIYGCFYLSGTYAYMIFIKNGKSIYLWIALLSFCLSFLGKEQAVTFPIMMMLLDFTGGRKFTVQTFVKEKLPALLLSFYFGMLSIASQQGIGLPEGFTEYSAFERIFIAFYSLTEYITKAILPIHLSYIYPFPFLAGERIPIWILIYPVLWLVVGITFYTSVRERRWTSFGVGFFLIHIVIALNLVSLARFSITADRYIYISLIGFCFILSYITTVLTEKGSFLSMLCYSAILIYVIVLGYSTNQRINVWRNSTTLKENVRSILKSRVDYISKRNELDKE